MTTLTEGVSYMRELARKDSAKHRINCDDVKDSHNPDKQIFYSDNKPQQNTYYDGGLR